MYPNKVDLAICITKSRISLGLSLPLLPLQLLGYAAFGTEASDSGGLTHNEKEPPDKSGGSLGG